MAWSAIIPFLPEIIGGAGVIFKSISDWKKGPTTTVRGPYGGNIASNTANWMNPIFKQQLTDSMARGFADNSARLNWSMPEITRRVGPGILAWSGTSGGRAGFQFGGGGNYTGIGKYDSYGSGAGTYGESLFGGGGGKTSTWTPPWRRDNQTLDDTLGDDLTEDQAAHPGRQMQTGLYDRQQAGGGPQGKMNEYRSVLKMRDSLASMGRLIRGSGMPGGGE